MSAEPISERIETKDGVAVAARFHAPAGVPKGGVVIASAMGVPQSYYEPLARWLADEGFLVTTFDYRGTFASRPRRMRGFVSDILAWARLDCAAILEATAARVPGKPLYWIGHSLGGQILPFVPNRDRLAKAVTVATGSGYWRENAPGLRRRAWWLWYVVAPVAMALCGYFHGARLRKVGDLPSGVMAQWRRWCLHPEYAVGDGEHVRALYAAVRTPIVSLSFHDDEFMSARNTESIHGFYVNAPRVMKRFAPQDVGLERIGHFGFFRARCEGPLWRPHLLPELG